MFGLPEDQGRMYSDLTPGFVVSLDVNCSQDDTT